MEPPRRQRIVPLLQKWQFNTAGCWSSPSVWDDFYVSDQIYIGELYKDRDVFDDSLWYGEVLDQLRREVQPFVERRDFIGYFLDNEPELVPAQLFELYLALGREKPGSRKFIEFLKDYYSNDIKALKQEWGTTLQAFERIPGAAPPAFYPPPMKQGVLPAWRNRVAAYYYSRYAAILRNLDPNHLILGVRYRGVPELDLYNSLNPFFDVNSVNLYLLSTGREAYDSRSCPRGVR